MIRPLTLKPLHPSWGLVMRPILHDFLSRIPNKHRPCIGQVWGNDGLTLAKPAAYGRLIKRYKRFLADVELASGEVIVLLPQSGRMLTCSNMSRVRLTHFTDGKRKYPYRLDLVHNGNHWIPRC